MLPFAQPTSVFQTEKCSFSYGTTGHLDLDRPPTIETTATAGSGSKVKKPWSNFQDLDYVFEVDLVLPKECAEEAQKRLVAARPSYCFMRMVMTVGQILEGDFFKNYIKAGNVHILSQGYVNKDDVFAFRNGLLTMFLDRESYERTGLVGRPHGAKGGRGLRSRWVLEFDLKAASMWPGKNGFDRLIYACNHVFVKPLTWLFHSSLDSPSPDPLTPYCPTVCTVIPTIATYTNVKLPPLERPASLIANENSHNSAIEAEEAVFELYEWISLVRLGSPRVRANDSIDPYLSRYEVPGTIADEATAGDVCTISWRGFFSPSWVCHTLLDAMLAFPSAKSWFAMSASGIPSSKNIANEGAECTLFKPQKASGDFLLWAIHGHE
ncbi:ribonuclease p protein subunit [Grosmannia clavigera kw1407]|uniref:Ribonuclease p protein subunit n=1 Tax=Grosmannia clavigera (strain kw1407 / UAMH 11150) TaxID=655863 RepID=F0XNT8_GROCL|nr:ribonuclease p protein subunit [Grosmannia clavigera kw1407]EFX00359.1 ribonuclease p protein subunit [Grosmannia clavigera kw1407]